MVDRDLEAAVLRLRFLGAALPDHRGADDGAVLGHQAAVRLLVEEQLRDSGDEQGEQDGDGGEHDGVPHRDPELTDDGHRVYTQCAALTSRSMSLMPMKGATMPPTP